MRDDRVAAGVARLGPADAGEVFTLQLAAWVAEGRANGTFDIPPLRENIADVREQLADPSWQVWGLREDGRLLATVRTRLLDVSTGYLGRLGVVPDRQGEGLGGLMLGHAEAHLPAGVRRVELITGARSHGNHAFYGARGYVIAVGSGDGGGTVRMVKQLP